MATLPAAVEVVGVATEVCGTAVVVVLVVVALVATPLVDCDILDAVVETGLLVPLLRVLSAGDSCCILSDLDQPDPLGLVGRHYIRV